MINKFIIDILKSINIPCYYMQAPKTRDDAYCIFSIFKEQDIGLYDNDNLKEVYYCTLNYWYSSPQDVLKYSEIKNLLKKNKVVIRDIVDMPVHEGYYGKSYSLKITRLLD